MGKWSIMRRKAVRSKLFWLTAAVSSRISETLDQLLYFLRQKTQPNEPANLAKLVWHTGAVTELELESLLDRETWINMGVSVLDTEDEVNIYVCGVVRLVLAVIAAYTRRIMSRIECWPYKFRWLAYKPAEEERIERAPLARELLRGGKGMHHTACKIRRIFLKELQQCVNNSGRVCMRLYVLAHVVAVQWQGDNQ